MKNKLTDLNDYLFVQLGERLNTDPSNWKLVPRALLPRLNGIYGRGYDSAPAELKPAIMAIRRARTRSSITSRRHALEKRCQGGAARFHTRIRVPTHLPAADVQTNLLE